LASAFTSLVFADGYEKVTVGRVVELADVGRSTFYAHFTGKEDLLGASMAWIFAEVADTVTSDAMPEALEPVLAHMWERRRLSDAIFSGAARLVLARRLADMIEERLSAIAPPDLSCPLRLSSIQLAEMQLALVESWLRGKAHCPPSVLARALHSSSRAAALALLGLKVDLAKTL
jgi:AcrR family transcriptional regulator